MLDLRTSHAHSCWPGESRSQCRYGDPFVPRTTTLIAYRPLFHAPTRLPQTHGAWPAVLSRRVWHARRFRVCLRGIVGPLAPAGQHNARNLRDPDDTAEFNKHIGWERFLRRIRARRETTRPDRVAGLNL